MSQALELASAIQQSGLAELLATAEPTKQDDTLVDVCIVSALVGLVIFLVGWFRRGASKLNSTLVFSGAALIVVSVLVAIDQTLP